MTLLREVMERPLDAGYEEAAERRRAGEEPDGPVRRALSSSLVMILAVLIGLGGVWAARELREPVPGASARSVLSEEIRERTADGTELASENAALQAEIQELQEQAFGDTAAEAIAEAEQLGVWAGTTPVVGPGIVITLEDSARAQAGETGTEDERVKDFDLQVVVNALWASGAESIAINGVRLTAATAIRTAGQTILVDLQPLVSPYRVEAIGDPDAMRSAFARTAGAALLTSLSSGYGITKRARRRRRTVAARRHRALRSASSRVRTAESGHACAHARLAADQEGRRQSMVAVIGLVVGVVLGLLLQPSVPAELQPYLPIAVVAALDALFGAVRARLEGKFDDRVFVTSFLFNVLVAAFIVFLGDQLGVGAQLSTAVVVVLGIRIFSNAASIRRHVLKA